VVLRRHLRLSLIALIGLAWAVGLAWPAGAWPGQGDSPALPEGASFAAIRDSAELSPADQAGLDSIIARVNGTGFNGEMVPSRMVNPACQDISEAYNQVKDLLIPCQDYWTAYENLRLIASGRADERLRVDFTLADKRHQAWTYDLPQSAAGGRTSCAALIIPGTGPNQGFRIVRADPTNYHREIAKTVSHYCDTFILVKPNEDFRAIHNKKNKLDESWMISQMINMGGSYSVTYLAESLAVMKQLRSEYDEVFVLGLSQGGLAALLSGIQSRPTGMFVASGYTVLSQKLAYWWGSDQILIPGLEDRLTPENVRRELSLSKTRTVFSWGKKDAPLYAIDARLRATARLLGSIKGVEYFIHEGKHQFPQDKVRSFLASFCGN